MTGELDDAGFAELSAKITRERNFGCASYKDNCLRRRIAVRMRASGASSFQDYAHALDEVPGEYERLMEALTINVTRFFRNREAFAALERSVVPVILDRDGPVHVWSAGCSSGEEAYSLATLFHRQAAARGLTHRLHDVRVIGSDIDGDSLAAASAAVYQPSAFADAPDELESGYFPLAGAGRVVHPEVRSLVRFERRDLLLDPAPPDPLQLIVCRNVVIYFNRSAQEDLFARFHAALAPGGFLVLGRVETLLGPSRALFTPVALRERVFRKK